MLTVYHVRDALRYPSFIKHSKYHHMRGCTKIVLSITRLQAPFLGRT